MVSLAGIGPASRPNPPKRTTVGWVAAGRSRRCRTFWRVALAITPTLCQQHSAAGDDHREQGQHVRHHAAGGARKIVSRVATKFFH